MKSGRKKDPFCSYYGLKETPDPIDELCGICGSDIWPGEAVSWDENNQICHAECMEKKEKEERKRGTVTGELIVVKQLPVIEEQLRTLKDRWEQLAADAKSMVCTEDTIQSVKAFRADMRKEFDEVEFLRKKTKQKVMEPYNRFEAVYEECITNAFQRADSACSRKVSEIENGMKRRCEDGLRDYFSELCAVHHLDWLTYERAGIKVDMASAKAKTPKKLREQLAAFVAGVAENVDRINLLDDAGEIMVEYQRTLDAASAICIVKERHRRVEEQKAAQEARKDERERETEMVRRVEALAPPVVVEALEPIVKCTFTVRATRAQLRKLKEFLNMEGIKYE